MKKETLKNHTMYTLELLFSQLKKIYKYVFQLFEEKKAGIACLLYSIILSKGFYEWVNKFYFTAVDRDKPWIYM